MNREIKLSQAAGTESSDLTRHEKAHILLTLAVPFLNGACKQIARYSEAANELPVDPIAAVAECVHEASCLFEDLATVAKYIEMCGEEHEMHQLFWDVRNLIRHDIRDKFDQNTWKKEQCAKRLGIPDHLQASIGFDKDQITVGRTNIELSSLTEYLTWAEEVVSKTLNEARRKGHIAG